MAMIVYGADFFAEGRAEALLQVDEYLRNKFRINLVSVVGPGHEKHINLLKRVITYGTDGLTWTGDLAHSKKFVDEVVEPGAQLRRVPRKQEGTTRTVRTN